MGVSSAVLPHEAPKATVRVFVAGNQEKPGTRPIRRTGGRHEGTTEMDRRCRTRHHSFLPYRSAGGTCDPIIPMSHSIFLDFDDDGIRVPARARLIVWRARWV
jgi:hypothetical protein